VVSLKNEKWHHHPSGQDSGVGDFVPKEPTHSSIDNYFTSVKRETLKSTLAKLCALDGLAFFVIDNSKTIPFLINKSHYGTAPSEHSIGQNLQRIAITNYPYF